jgi:enoyl-CoA hydratase/carnithine racemase
VDVVDLHEVVALGVAGLDEVSVLHRAAPLVVDVPAAVDATEVDVAAEVLRRAPTVTVVAGRPDHVPPILAEAADVCLTARGAGGSPPRPWVGGDPGAVEDAVAAQPLAATALAVLLRTTAGLPVWDGIAAEASTYGLLLGGPAHRSWLEGRRPSLPHPIDGPPVRVEREGSVLRVVLDRPDVRNAVDRATRDALVDALAVASADPELADVVLSGAGPCFSAGGDLDEFGTVDDGPTSFAVRLARHPGWAVHAVADRVTARVHGACVGAGIEVPAFAGTVVADPGTTFRLPELAMGLVPGAGGTVSLPRRIGRQRTAWLALTGQALDAPTALAWGLVDRLEPVPPTLL